MELHTLGIGRYLGETTLPGEAGTGYSDQDVTNAARVLTGWTIADGHQKAADGSQPNTGAFLFNSHNHDFGPKILFGVTYPAGVGQDEGEDFSIRWPAIPVRRSPSPPSSTCTSCRTCRPPMIRWCRLWQRSF